MNNTWSSIFMISSEGITFMWFAEVICLALAVWVSFLFKRFYIFFEGKVCMAVRSRCVGPQVPSLLLPPLLCSSFHHDLQSVISDGIVLFWRMYHLSVEVLQTLPLHFTNFLLYQCYVLFLDVLFNACQFTTWILHSAYRLGNSWSLIVQIFPNCECVLEYRIRTASF